MGPCPTRPDWGTESAATERLLFDCSHLPTVMTSCQWKTFKSKLGLEKCTTILNAGLRNVNKISVASFTYVFIGVQAGLTLATLLS